MNTVKIIPISQCPYHGLRCEYQNWCNLEDVFCDEYKDCPIKPILQENLELKEKFKIVTETLEFCIADIEPHPTNWRLSQISRKIKEMLTEIKE